MTLLSGDEVEQRLRELDGWHADGAQIERELEFADFAAAIAFANRVADRAEAANHHPDIFVHGWNKVRLTLSTHSEGGVTEADLALAAEIDRVA